MTDLITSAHQRVHGYFAKKRFFEGEIGNQFIAYIDDEKEEIINARQGDHLEIPEKGEEVILSRLEPFNQQSSKDQNQTGVFEVISRIHRHISVEHEDKEKSVSGVYLYVRNKDETEKWVPNFHINDIEDDY